MTRLLCLIIGALFFPRTSRDRPSPPDSEELHRIRERAHWRHQTTIGWTATLLSAAAVLAAIYTLREAILAVNEAHRQVEAALGQLEVMRREQRPWIKVSLDRVREFTVVPHLITHPNSARGTFDMYFKIQNVGHLPAFNVRFHVWAFVPSPGRNDPQTAQHESCEQFRHERLDPDRGQVIFPGDSMGDTDFRSDGGHASPMIYSEDIAKATRLGVIGKGARVYIYGCADYTFEAGGKERNCSPR